MPVEFLPNARPGALLAVDMAFGADLDEPASSWDWTEITTDVRVSDQIEITTGRSDEASTSQPASCSVLLDNASGDYSRGGQSARWPHIRLSTPLRVRIAPDGETGGGSTVLVPPSYSGSFEVSSWVTFTNPKTVTNVAARVGDLLVVHAATFTNNSGDDEFGDPPEITEGGEVDAWAEVGRIAETDYCAAKSWTAEVTEVTSGSDELTVELGHTAGSHKWGFVVEVWRDHGGPGATGDAFASTGGPELTLSDVAEGSAISLANADWNAVAGARTYREDDAGPADETVHVEDSELVVDVAHHSDAGAAGDKTIGLTAPSGQKWGLIGVEVLGTEQSGAGGGYRVPFLGYVASWTPGWNQTGRIPTVAVTAAGVLRRLGQGESPVLSPLRRRLTSEDNVIAYWPLEDGSRSSRFGSAVPEAAPMLVSAGQPDRAAFEEFPCSGPVPTLDGATLVGYVPDRPASGTYQARTLISIPDGGLAQDNDVFRVYFSGASLAYVRAETYDDGSLGISALARDGSEVFDSGPVGFGLTDETVGRLFIELEQNGDDLDWLFGFQDLTGLGAGTTSGTTSNVTLGKPTRVVLNAYREESDAAVGHVVVQNEITSIFDDAVELSGFDGELAGNRLGRLCDENGIRLDVLPAPAFTTLPTDRMGPQRVAPIVELLRDAETVDQGILYDGIGDGLTYYLRRRRENRDPVMTLSADRLAEPPEPVDDDQGVRNRVVASRPDGGSEVYEDRDGPLGIRAIGRFEDSIDVACQDDSALTLYAGWLVHTGTVDTYRHPGIRLDMRATPDLIDAWLDVLPGDGLDVTGIADVAAGHEDERLALEVQGSTQTIGMHEWSVSINCGPKLPWRIGVPAEDSGDGGEYLIHLQTDGSRLDETASAGATTLAVETTDGPLWTTDPDDFPFDVEVGGIPIEVTAISGESSPQTFTVTDTDVTKNLDAGLDMTVFRPTVLGL